MIGRGWDQNQWNGWNETEFPTQWDLDSRFSKYKVSLTRIDGHALWCNNYTLSLVTIPDQNPEGGTIVRNQFCVCVCVCVCVCLYVIHIVL